MLSVISDKVTGESHYGIFVADRIYLNFYICVAFLDQDCLSGLNEGGFGDRTRRSDYFHITISRIRRFLDRSTERLLEIKHHWLRHVLHIIFFVHAQESCFFFYMQGQAILAAFLVVYGIAVEERFGL